ncbi:MAG: membrane protein insertion efficiency factor YidD [Pseudomonadota bacterium]
MTVATKRGRLARLIVIAVRGYQRFVSPWFASHCRYQPTCSQYMIDAVERYGAWRGVRLGLRRLGRCHPWGGHGYDPVP